MTKAPEKIEKLAEFWDHHGGRNLGIVGDTKHKQRGTSYHLGSSDLIDGAYSTKLKRDRKGLTKSASALDLGKLNKRIGKLRKFSNWLVEQAEEGLTPDIREIIWSPDGKEVRRWDSHLDKVIVSLRRRKDGIHQGRHRGQRRRVALLAHTHQLLSGLGGAAEGRLLPDVLRPADPGSQAGRRPRAEPGRRP